MKRELFSSFTYTLLSSGLFFGFNFFIAKVLGANEYGQIVYYLSFINILALIISLNYSALYMGSSIIDKNKKTFSLFISWQTLLFLVILLPAYFILKHFFDSSKEILFVLLTSYLLTIVSTIGLEFNSKKEVAKSILASALLPRVYLITIFVVLIIFGVANSLNYLYAYFISLFLVATYFIIKLKPTPYISSDILKRAWKFYLLGVIGTSFTYLAQILQKRYGDYEILATLAIVLLFFAGLSLVGAVLVKFVLPKIHEYYREDRFKEIGELYSNNTKIVLMVVVPVLVFLYFNLENISKLLGKGYSDLPTIFAILLLGYIADLVTGITGYLLRATKNEKYEIYNEVARLIVGLALIYLLKDNRYGVAIAISASMLLYNLLKYMQVYYLFKFVPLSLREFTVAGVLILVLITIFYLLSTIDLLYIKLSIEIIILVAIYLAILLYIKKESHLLKGYK